MSLRCECLVIGGGPAGAMAALRLAAAGRDVVLVERERGANDKVCGEFLSAEGVEYLRTADVDPVALGAVKIERLRMTAGKQAIETALPFAALSLSRRVLDEAMLERAAAQGCRVMRGAVVDTLARSGTGWDARCADGCSLQAAHVFLATGKHDLRGRPRPEGRQRDLIGFKVHLRLDHAQSVALHGAMELFLFPGGYGGLALVEKGMANLCLVVRRSVLRNAGGWDAVLESVNRHNAVMETRLARSEMLWDRPLAIAPIPYGHLATRSDGVWPLGDQAAVIPSFTGDGMSIALHSGALAARLFLAGSGPDAYLRTLSRQLRRGMHIATAISRLMVSAPAVTAAPAILRVLPPMLGWIANSTRIPHAARKASLRAA